MFCSFIKGLLGWGLLHLPDIPAHIRRYTRHPQGQAGGAEGHLHDAHALFYRGGDASFLRRDGFAFGGDFLDLCSRLYASGTRLASGGLLAGLLSMALEEMFSVYGAIPVLLAIIVCLVMCAARMTPGRLLDMWQGARACAV